MYAVLAPTARDRHITKIESHGRMTRQKATGYSQRSRCETLMDRWKSVIGPKLMARTFENQKTEAKIGVRVLNGVTGHLAIQVSNAPHEFLLG